ncbi:MAG: histidine kinase dimerization/phospho-acceptor domain-containing protein, partial [Candidatus Margulisiibacteriota bacterium]
MAFSAMLICIELINGYFDHQLENKAQTVLTPIEHSFNQMASKTFLEFSNNAPTSFNQVLQHSNLQNTFGLTVINNRFFLYEPNSVSLSLIPFSFEAVNFSKNLRNIYIELDNKIYNINNMSASLSLAGASSFKDISKNGQRYRRFFTQHPQISHLYFYIDVHSEGIEKKRNSKLAFVLVGLFLVNEFIIVIFSIILKHITRSLTEMTQAAKNITKGQMITPMKVKSNDEFGLLAQSFNNMLNSVQTKTAELIYEKNRSKMILAQLPDGIIVTDLNHKLFMANRAAENMLGFSTDCAKGHELIQYLKDENLQSLFSDELKQIESNQLVREVNINDAKGNDQLYQITISPLLDSTYQKTGLITVIRNITQENQTRYLKDNFLRSVTHELKTPLTSIIGFLNILKKELHGNLNDKQKEFLTISLLNSSMLKKLINNLLDLSIIHSGQLKLNKST